MDRRLAGCLAVGLWAAVSTSFIAMAEESVSPQTVIPIDFDMPSEGSSGGLIAADLNGDGQFDFVVTAPGHIGAYQLKGDRLWKRDVDVRVSAGSSESKGLPGHHAPGVQVADIDGDGIAELLYLDQSSTVHALDGRTGKEKWAQVVPHPEKTERWEHLVIANLRGRGDSDLILQTTNAEGYRTGIHVAAYVAAKLDRAPLWEDHEFGALAHGPLRIADLDSDGRDEVCGFKILHPNGKKTRWSYPEISKENADGASFHIDSLFIEDVRPDIPGLEVVLLEEGRDYIGLANLDRGMIWWKTVDRQEPQNAVVGEFDTSRPGLEIWCRSRYNTHQKPWILDAQGELIRQYNMDDVAPPGWTEEGVEVIWPIHWTGNETQLAAGKERHKSGDVCLFDPLSGQFTAVFKEKADRIYVADVSGDWREEIVVVAGPEIHVYENSSPNPQPTHPRLWDRQSYRRSKMSWNYYSP